MPSKVRFLLCGAAVCLCAACGSKSPRATQVTPAVPPSTPVAVAPAPAVPADPIVELIAASDRHFAAGQKELGLGHLDRAKSEFNRAVEVLLQSPGGARADARVREHFDRLVDRISALELNALATGDGFTERANEPASIDALLAISTFDTTAPTALTTQTVQADLASSTHDIPIPMNDRVLRYVELFQGRLREFLADGLSRGAQYLPMIQNVFRAEGLPLDLAYVPLIESAFKPNALSRAKAKGVWQFMRGTAIENGLRHDWYIDERADPEKATVAAAKYLKTLYGMFGDWHLAMASYNGGPGRVQRAVKRSGRDDFWSLTATSRYLPRETREYVPMILAAVIIAKNPAQYGFDVLRAEPRAAETVSVPAAVDLRRVAEMAGVPVDELQQMNPELRRWTTPIRGERYNLKVPPGTAARVEAALEQAPANTLNALQWHTVKRGESIATIARKLGVSRADLAEANYRRTNSRVNPGEKLLIPRMPSAALLARAAAGSSITAESDAAPAVAGRAEDGAASRDADESSPVVYRVRSGDTLFGIARRHGISVDDLKIWNKLRGSRLNVGDRLVIRTGRSAANQQ